MRRVFLRVLTLVAVTLAAGPAARAIPEAQALAKLRVIPVHLLVDGKGVPLPIPKDKTLVLPLYLDRQRAQSELQQIRSRQPGQNVALATLPLSEANALVASLTKDLKPGYRLLAPVLPRRQDLEKATTLLQQKGLTAAQIRQGLTVPIFFTRPFLTAPTAEGERGLLFLSYADLQQALSKQSGSPSRRVEVADITAVLHRLMQTPQDLFVFRAPQSGGSDRPSRALAPPPPPPLPGGG